MTGSESGTQDPATRPISVAELLARNAAAGSTPVAGRRRRRRGNSDAVTVAELTGEIPVIRDDAHQPAPAAEEPVAPPPAEAAESEPVGTVGWSESGPRWPKSMPGPLRAAGPEQSHYPRPARRSDSAGAEQMSPDPVHNYPAAAAVDLLDAEVRSAEPLTDDAVEVRTGSGIRRRFFGWRRRRADDSDVADSALETAQPVPDDETTDPSRLGDLDDDHADIEADLAGEPAQKRSLWSELGSGAVIVLQSMLAVLLGAGLFIAFDQLWHWNDIVALVLTVLVTLGLVAAVQAVRRTVDIGSTLIAVAVGLLITLGPLALHAN